MSNSGAELVLFRRIELDLIRGPTVSDDSIVKIKWKTFGRGSTMELFIPFSLIVGLIVASIFAATLGKDSRDGFGDNRDVQLPRWT